MASIGELGEKEMREAALRKSKCITIMRGHFDPTLFIDEGWSIVTEKTDTRSTAITELDLTKVQQVTMLRDGEVHVGGEERLIRLKSSDYVRLDADIFYTLWKNQHLIPESWKEKVGGNARIFFFDGTILRSLHGYLCVLCLYWDDGRWRWRGGWLDCDCDCYDLSAVLVSQ